MDLIPIKHKYCSQWLGTIPQYGGPRPLATFEEFADSSLNLCLRAYVPDLDSRLKTITELHTEIDRRFAEAGIEIAFPQQDIHLRSSVNYQPSQTDSFMSKTEEA